MPGCDDDRENDLCWEEVDGRFTSDNDVYMEFDDRWAHRGNMVDTIMIISRLATQWD